MWAERIVLLTRGSSRLPSLHKKAHVAFEQVTEETIQTGEHSQEIFLSLYLSTSTLHSVCVVKGNLPDAIFNQVLNDYELCFGGVIARIFMIFVLESTGSHTRLLKY